MLTHSCLDLLAQQFFTVFSRCGGSDMKKRNLSRAYGLGVLCTNDCCEVVCSLKSRLFAARPSHIRARTLNPFNSKRAIASQTIEYNSAPVIEVQGNWAYGNANGLKRPLTISTSMEVASGIDTSLLPLFNFFSYSARC